MLEQKVGRLMGHGLTRCQATSGERRAGVESRRTSRNEATSPPAVIQAVTLIPSTAQRGGCRIAPMRILLIEDDLETTRFVRKGLEEAGYVVDHTGDGKQGLLCALDAEYDVLVVDRMLPGLDGLSIVRSLRAAGQATPVLVLSALGEVDDRVEGLRSGGDDYLVKPFAFAELSARIEALARRHGDVTGDTAPVTRFTVADLEMDLLARTVKRAGRSIQLKPREFRLLEHLMRHAEQVVTRTMLLEAVWDYHFDPQTNVIDVHISRLRRKIDRGFDRTLIHTVRGAGYVIREP